MRHIYRDRANSWCQTCKQTKILKHLSQQCVFHCMPLPPQFLQVYCNSTFLFLSCFTLLLLVLFAFYLPAVLILLSYFFTLHLILFHSLLYQYTFPGFCSGSPPRSSLSDKGSRELTESLLATRTEENLFYYLTPPVSPAKPPPPELLPFRSKRQ